MPGVLMSDSQGSAEATPEVKDGTPSRLDGPELTVHFPTALDMIRSAFDRFSEKLAVATMYQPSNHLEKLFGSEPKLAFDSSRDYQRWTFAQLKHGGEMLAAALAARGVEEGDTIAFLARGCVEFHMIFYASMILKCRYAPMNPQSANNSDEIAHMLKVVGATVVLAPDQDVVTLLNNKIPDTIRTLKLTVAVDKPTANDEKTASTEYQAPFTYFEDLVLSALPVEDAKASLKKFEDLPRTPEDIVWILFTSGTTSLPKACPMSNTILTSIATAFGNGPTGGPTAAFASHLPMYHIAGSISAGWNPLTSGAAVVHPAPHFTPKTTLQAMKLEEITYMILVPTMLGLMLNDPALPPPDQLSIRCMSLGASTILYTDVEKCYEFLGCKKMITSYGMTEGLMMTRGFLPREATPDAVNGIQRICAGARLKICYPNTRIIVPRGEPGEVHQSGACTIKGYLGKESDNFYEDEDGVWCVTGDQAVMQEDGGMKITGRYKDLIIRGGVNISPQAIEGVISRVLGLDAQVVGMPDSIAGEVPVAIVKTGDVDKTSMQKLREPIVKELGPRFALEKFISLDELGLKDFPRTSTGKIRKVDLQAVIKQYAIDNQNKTATPSGNNSDKNVLQRIMETWSEIAGIALDDVTPESSVHDMADSLMLARFAGIVRESFGVPFTLQDMSDNGTLGAQAALIETRAETDASNADLVNSRPGPPSVVDMVHVEEDESAASWTQTTVEKVLKPLGFTWEDVEDVLTPSQWLQSWVKSRETSDRFRGAYVAGEADVETFTEAFKETLHRNDSLRAISVPCGDSTDLQAILRYSDKWVEKVIRIQKEPVKTAKDLQSLIPPDTKLINGLVQIVIAPVEETGTAGACMMTLHTTFDAFSLDIMRKDLNALLNKKTPKQHVPYKLWADHLYNERESAQAKAAVAFNVKRLHGLAEKRSALWPPQRTKVWQRGCDLGLHVTPEGEMTSKDDPGQRELLDGPAENCCGSVGELRQYVVENLAAITKDQSIPPPIIVKAALSLLETRHTGENTALFSQTFAMRDNWPFIDEWMSRRLPSPLEVTGPTLSRIAEIIPVGRKQTVMEWLQELKGEQEKLIRHAHAPYRVVYDRLNGSSSDNSDAGSSLGYPSRKSSYADFGIHRSYGDFESRKNSVPYTNGSASGYGDSPTQSEINGFSDGFLHVPTNDHHHHSSFDDASPKAPTNKENFLIFNGTEEEYVPPAQDGDVMESIRRRINLQWLPIFKLDKKMKPLVRFVGNSHFNEVGLAIKSGMLADQKTIWIKMEWDDGNIRHSEATAWIEEMIKYVELLCKEENWQKSVEDLWELATGSKATETAPAIPTVPGASAITPTPATQETSAAPIVPVASPTTATTA